MLTRQKFLQEERGRYFLDREHLMDKPLFDTSLSFTVDGPLRSEKI
jgi:hypothetical protein